jgi:hypothetical protein
MSIRKIKIEATGDFYLHRKGQGSALPKIRLAGKWLAAAGFPPGQHVHVVITGPGRLTLSIREEALENPPLSVAAKLHQPFYETRPLC